MTDSEDFLVNTSVGFLGYGEIGTSLYNIYKKNGYKNLIIRDPFKDLHNKLENCKIVNVCIPFFSMEKFITSIKELNLNTGTYLIIQSTVGIGICDKIQEQLDLIVLHSPVRGIHPNLTEGILTFDKYIGVSEKFYENYKIRIFIENHLSDLKIKPIICKARESELAKIVSTTLYGINIAAINDVANLCEKYNADFDIVFTKWQIGYNKGYAELNHHNVSRPILTPTPKNDKGKRLIGGHCVIPNSVILKNMGNEEMANYVLRYADESNLKHVNNKRSN